jgi:hypothetical protein
MLLRRLYSSLPQRAATTPAATVAPKAHGRTRPVRIKVARVKPAAPESSVATSQTHGRRLRRSLAARPAEDFFSSEVPKPAGFQPVTLYPFQAGLHISLTPRHMPLPVHLGTKPYLEPKSGSEARATGTDTLFQRPATPSPLEGVELSGPSPLGQHLSLTKALSHPSLAHHLGRPVPKSSLRALDVDSDLRVEEILDTAATAHAEAAEDAWNAVLSKLGIQLAETTICATEQANIDSAIADLNGLLARLESTDGDAVHMDSVQRKRKKKMNKHKFKKRRKVSLIGGQALLQRQERGNSSIS